MFFGKYDITLFLFSRIEMFYIFEFRVPKLERVWIAFKVQNFI